MSLRSEILAAIGQPDQNIKVAEALVKVINQLQEDIENVDGGGGGGPSTPDTGIFGESLSAGASIYLKVSDGRWYKTDASNVAKSGPVLLAIAMENGITGETKDILLLGNMVASAYSGFAVSAKLYLSATPGLFTATAPNTAGHIIRSIGHRDAITNQISFKPSADYFTVA